MSKKQAEAGKGSAPRKSADQSKYAENHGKIFKTLTWLEKKKQQEEAFIQSCVKMNS